MQVSRFRRFATATVLASAAMIATAQPASAAATELPRGVGCEFPLGLDGGAFPPERRSFTDRNGNAVTILAGKSPTSQLLEFSGHVGLALFPTDEPAGPSTTQITGRLVLRYNPETGFTEVVKREGKQIDVCAALS